MPLYGRLGTILAKPGEREALLAILVDASRGATAMPGCRSYVVGPVPGDPNAIATTEIWDDKVSHAASLTLDAVRAMITRARPLIAGFGPATEFEPRAGA